ncbi:expressed unknown protein [Seminavis robusta]|uniref:Uncharacterized protein n=1 Tax=Seminavis robusta TaxID=568900 RepID=A0A9N8EUB2_9STRA|nr:expressed unknown protein [Seminavis robusta]|eukprot:Sro1711_g292780.1 n/a (238) ;mRNA; r:665-1378
MWISLVIVSILASLAPANGFNSYLNQMGGDGGVASMKSSSFAPSGKPMAAPRSGTGGYLDNIGGGGTAVATPPPPPPPAGEAAAAVASTAPAVGDYLASLPVQEAPSGGGVPGYLDALLTASAPSGGGVPGYLDALPASSAPSGSGVPSYLDAIAPGSGSAPVASSFAPKPTFVPAGSPPSGAGGESNVVLEAISDMTNNMNRNQQTSISILKEISVGIKGLVEKVEGQMAGDQPWQ